MFTFSSALRGEIGTSHTKPFLSSIVELSSKVQCLESRDQLVVKVGERESILPSQRRKFFFSFSLSISRVLPDTKDQLLRDAFI